MTKAWMLEKTWTLRSAAEALLATAPADKRVLITPGPARRFKTICHHCGSDRGGSNATLVAVE